MSAYLLEECPGSVKVLDVLVESGFIFLKDILVITKEHWVTQDILLVFSKFLLYQRRQHLLHNNDNNYYNCHYLHHYCNHFLFGEIQIQALDIQTNKLTKSFQTRKIFSHIFPTTQKFRGQLTLYPSLARRHQCKN